MKQYKQNFLSLWNYFCFQIDVFGGLQTWNSSQNWAWHVPLVAKSHVCLCLQNILANCVFLTVFPTIVDPFEPSFSFFHLFPVFSAIEVLFCLTFRVCEKIFFLCFCWIFLGPVGGHALVVGLATWVYKSHKLRAPKTQYNDLVLYRCRLHLQLTTMSDNLDFIKFYLLLQYGPSMVPGLP